MHPSDTTTIQVHVPLWLVSRLDQVLAKERERTGTRVTKKHIITFLLIDYVQEAEKKEAHHGI